MTIYTRTHLQALAYMTCTMQTAHSLIPELLRAKELLLKHNQILFPFMS